jgi:hypothetical protein
MVTRLYAVRDSKLNEYNQPYSLANDEVAKRVLSMAVNDSKKSMMTQYPSDYDLYWIGEYNSVSGEVIPCKPVHVCSASSLVEQSSGS